MRTHLALGSLAALAVLVAVAMGGIAALARGIARDASARTAVSSSSVTPRCTPSRLNSSAVLPGTPLSVSPLPDSYDATPSSQISMLGVPASAIAAVHVEGSQSGTHHGRLRAYSQGDGASFLPSSRFTSGETVTVTGVVHVAHRSTRFAFHFVVAHEDVLPYSRATHRNADPNEKLHFHSAPLLEPPLVTVTARSAQTSPGLMFATPYNGPGPSGPMIFDEAGNLVWFNPLPAGTESTNLQVQQLDGKPVLTWWQGYIPPQGFGQGEEMVYSTSYTPIGRVHAGNGLKADLHEFHINSDDTALTTVFNPVDCDLRAYRGSAGSAVTDSIFKEIDLRTGLVRREWHSLDHVPLSDSYSSAVPTSRTWPFDYFHINSVQRTPSGGYLISARNTWALYELDGPTGKVGERIGGRHSDVRVPHAGATAFQHDATMLPDGTISIFDNGAVPKVHSQSRGLVVSLRAGSSEAVVTELRHPAPLLAGSQGGIQLLANGDLFVGWGAAPYFSEFSSSGQLLFDAHMHGSYQSYRAYRFAWTGEPRSRPAIAAAPTTAKAPVTVFASWNGDTRTATWQVLAGSSPQTLTPVATAARSGFETAIGTPAAAPYVAVQALDASGAVIGTSGVIHG
ncbi:MAG TPA: arylsulfotransferase family protein [Solirubrobacteraceae bacterium]|nr:arylsulfotransferase family protein [Solirubrobacteraceae bacterium]